MLYFLFLLNRLYNLKRRLRARSSTKLWNVRSWPRLCIPNRRSKLRSAPASTHSSGHWHWWSIHWGSEGHLLNRSLCRWLFLLLFLFLASFKVKFMRRALTSAAISALFNNRHSLYRGLLFVFNLLHRRSNDCILFCNDFLGYKHPLLFLGLLRLGFLF